MILDPNRFVGYESRKSYARRCNTGFWHTFVVGPRILDIGFRGGEPEAKTILPGALGLEPDVFQIDRDTPPYMAESYYTRYDGFNLPFADNVIDTVHCSHTLEHVAPPIKYIREWFRVLRVGGTLILFVPHAHLYERRITVPPSRWSPEHLRSYTVSSLSFEIETALSPNTYRVRHLADNDTGYDYSLPITQHPTGALEIELVLEKITPPSWKVEP